MTSKNLYWVKWKENIKRRGWTFVICLVSLFLFFPVTNTIQLNSMRNGMEEAARLGVTAEELAGYFQNMQQHFAESVGFSIAFGLCMALFAILFAVQGFSFLYSQRKMDLYMSVPVSAPKRFIMLWANGVLMFAFCYLLNLILTWGIGAAFGVMDCELMAGSVLAFFVNMTAFTAMYQVALLAVLLTGNVLTALLGCSVLFVYEWIVRILYGQLKSNFFASYCQADQARLDNLPWLSPFCGYLSFSDRIRYQGNVISGYGQGAYFYRGYSNENWCSALVSETLLLLLAVVLCGALVYLLFRRRKTESYHQAIAFSGMKGVLECFLLVPFSLAVAVLISEMASDRNFFLFAGALGGLVIGHGIIQLIYERDLKAVVRKRGTLLVSIAASVLVLVWFRFDLAGFDAYLPKREKIESVSVSLETDYSDFGWKKLQESTAASSNAAVRLMAQMNSSEEETINAVLHMVEIWQEAGRPVSAADGSGVPAEKEMAELKSEQGDGTGTESNPWGDSNWFVVRYNLTDKRSVYRRFRVDAAMCRQDLNTVMRDESYRKLRYQIYGEDFAKAVDAMKIVYFDGRQELLYTTDKTALLTALRKDFEDYDFNLIETQLPCGILRFSMPDSQSYRGYDWAYPVYASFSETVNVLAENEIDVGAGRSIFAAEDVKEITVTYDYYDDAGDEDLRIFEPGEVAGQTIICTFEDREEIEQILDGLYSYQLADVAGREFRNVVRNEGRFSVSLSLTPEAVKKRYTAGNLYFKEGGIPDFVKKKIEESAVRG